MVAGRRGGSTLAPAIRPSWTCHITVPRRSADRRVDSVRIAAPGLRMHAVESTRAPAISPEGLTGRCRRAGTLGHVICWYASRRLHAALLAALPAADSGRGGLSSASTRRSRRSTRSEVARPVSSGASLLASEPAPRRQSTSCLHLGQERRPPVEHRLVRGVSRARVSQHPVQLRLLLLGLQFVATHELLCPLHEETVGSGPSSLRRSSRPVS